MDKLEKELIEKNTELALDLDMIKDIVYSHLDQLKDYNTKIVESLKGIIPRVQELLGEAYKKSGYDVSIRSDIAEVIGMVDVISAVINNDKKLIKKLEEEVKEEKPKRKRLKIVK